MERAYICIDLKSYYASVECVYRGLDPLRTNLLVADESRSEQTICLAVSPPLKAIGVPARPRLFEARRAIKKYEEAHRTKVDYIIARPRMAEYERISVLIYSIYLRYAAPEDVHIYSIDECFIDCTPYLNLYREEAEKNGVHPAHLMAMTMIRDVLRTTGITATVGIGTNLYLAKVAMDIVAKKRPADRDGVRIAELSEDSYKFLLWDHRPLTDFWQIGPGKARRLMKAHMLTMGDVARRSLWDEEFFYRQFGIDGEILIDHAWGIEPVTMKDIKSYIFHDNGNGGYFDPEGTPHQIGWSIGEGGSIQIFYVETEQLSGRYTLMGDEMVITEQNGDKVCETHLKKVAEFSNKNIKETQ